MMYIIFVFLLFCCNVFAEGMPKPYSQIISPQTNLPVNGSLQVQLINNPTETEDNYGQENNSEQEEAEDVEEKVILPSVQNMETKDSADFRVKSTACIVANNPDLISFYNKPRILEISFTQFNGIPCEEFIKKLNHLHKVYNTILEIAEGKFCVQNISIENTTKKKAIEVRDHIEAQYMAIAKEYIQYFPYNQLLFEVENCMNNYSNIILEHSLTKETAIVETNIHLLRKSILKKVKAFGLRGIYGEEILPLGVGIEQMIQDFQQGIVSPRKISNYAIFEDKPLQWKQVGVSEEYLIYFKEGVYIGIPFVSGVSYSCEKLPFNLFRMQKIIEFPEKGYSVFVFKPLD